MASLLEAQRPTGDESSFDQLYRTYKGDVQRLAGRLLRNSADGEDATQTVFLNVLRALRQGVRPTEPRAWLLAITHNVCRSRQRAVACRPNEVELDPEQLTSATNGDAPTTDDIVGALARMRPNQRTALILRDFRGGTSGEISELLGLTPVGVEALLARARVSFRQELEAGDQPFDCAETRELVRRQVIGSISVGDRHSLKAHLRHCSPCAGAARSLRSSLGKLTSLIVWPAGIVERFANLFTQLPTAHVAGAVASTALVTSVAVPVALSPHKTVSRPTTTTARTAPSHQSRPALPSPQASSPAHTEAASQGTVAQRVKAERAAHAPIAAAAAVAAVHQHARPEANAVLAHTARAAVPEPASSSEVAAATAGPNSPLVGETTAGTASPQQPAGLPTSGVRVHGRQTAPTVRSHGRPRTQPTGSTSLRRPGRPSRGRRRGIVPPTQIDGDAPTAPASSGGQVYGNAGATPAASPQASDPPAAAPTGRTTPADPPATQPDPQPAPSPTAAAPPAPTAEGSSGSAGDPGTMPPHPLH